MLYVGNLPPALCDSEALRATLAAAAIPVAAVQVRKKRGFAWVELLPHAHIEEACVAISAIALDGHHQLTAQPAGESARQQLREWCQQHGLAAPHYDLFTEADGKHARVRVVLENGSCVEARSLQGSTSFKTSKEGAAEQCLALLNTEGNGAMGNALSGHDAQTPDQISSATMTLNLVDCPGHIDFNSEVTAALRMADGAMVVVDVLEGVCAQTRTVLRQALLEGVKPVLVLNKFDRLLLELRQTPEEVTSTVLSAIAETNALIREALGGDGATGPDGMPWTVSILDGSVIFGSGYFGWLCSLDQMLGLVARERDPTASLAEVCQFAEAVKKAARASETKLREAVEAMMVRPLLRIHRCIEKQDRSLIEERLRLWNFTPALDDWEQPWKKQLKAALSSILPASQCMLRMFMQHLPGPSDSQRYRMPFLCQWMQATDDAGSNSSNDNSSDDDDDDEEESKQEQPQPEATKDDRAYIDAVTDSLLRCDPNGPLMLFIIKMVPLPPQNKHLVAIGRVYSGSVRAGDTVYVCDGSVSSQSTAVRVTRLVGFVTPSRMVTLESCQAGDVCGFLGIDSAVVKSATLCSRPTPKLHFNPLPFTVTPVVSVSIRPKRTEQIAKFTDAMRVVTKTDPGAHFQTHPETGEHLLSGVGELHLEVLIASVQEMTHGSLELEVSDPIITFRETVTTACSTPCLTKSVNKHNRLYFTAQPLDATLVEALEAGEVGPATNPQERSRLLVGKFGWDSQHAKKILAFGPEDTGPNILVDATTGLSNLNSIRDSLIAAFEQVTMAGPVAGQRLRGVRIDLVDAVIHADNVHKRPAQIVPAASRGMQAAVLASSPRISEPLYNLSVEAPQGFAKDVTNVVHQRRGQIQTVESSLDQSMTKVEALIPVKDSIGLTGELRGATSGKVNVSLMTAGWQGITSDPLESGSPANQLAVQLRTTKKMSAPIPRVVDLVDRL